LPSRPVSALMVQGGQGGVISSLACLAISLRQASISLFSLSSLSTRSLFTRSCSRQNQIHVRAGGRQRTNPAHACVDVAKGSPSARSPMGATHLLLGDLPEADLLLFVELAVHRRAEVLLPTCTHHHFKPHTPPLRPLDEILRGCLVHGYVRSSAGPLYFRAPTVFPMRTRRPES
jgi:hypothetical protein